MLRRGFVWCLLPPVACDAQGWSRSDVWVIMHCCAQGQARLGARGRRHRCVHLDAARRLRDAVTCRSTTPCEVSKSRSAGVARGGGRFSCRQRGAAHRHAVKESRCSDASLVAALVEVYEPDPGGKHGWSQLDSTLNLLVITCRRSCVEGTPLTAKPSSDCSKAIVMGPRPIR